MTKNLSLEDDDLVSLSISKEKKFSGVVARRRGGGGKDLFLLYCR